MRMSKFPVKPILSTTARPNVIESFGINLALGTPHIRLRDRAGRQSH